MSDFDVDLSNKTKTIEEKIYKFCPEEDGLQKIIFEAMNYSVKAGGKRLRPMLMLETSKLFDGNDKDIYAFMAAIEMIHTYSLVHDDLPAMDNDDYRRGIETTHKKFGEDIAILAGDGLLNYAYEIMSRQVVASDNIYNCAKAMEVISRKAGIYGMVGGQTVDVLNENNDMDIETINFIHNLKTAALIEASMIAGAILGNATEDEINIIEKIANRVGIAFQIQDDILDVTSTTKELGKPVHSDEKNNKTTYVTLVGIDKAKQIVEEYSNEAIELLNSIDKENDFLYKLILKLINRKK